MVPIFVTKTGILRYAVFAAFRSKGTAQNGRRFGHTSRKEVRPMRFTWTFHIKDKTFTISFVVKSKNRHSGGFS